MSWTSHDKFFGWVHSFKINKNNVYLNPDPSTRPPFPAIVPDPSYQQVLKNWNRADTGILITMAVFGLLYSSRAIRKTPMIVGYLDKKYQYYRYVNMAVVVGIYLGLNNSCNRLTGMVPNGLPREEEP